MGFFLLILAITLPLATAVDKLWRHESKAKLANHVKTRIENAPKQAHVSTIFDKYFGEAIFSWRSFRSTLYLSLTVFLISAIFLYLAFPPTFADAITIPFSSKNNLLCLVIMVAMTILADFFSYGQTRIFMKVLETTPGKLTSLILLISDFVASLFFFLFFYTIGFVLCMSIILSGKPETSSFGYRYLPQLYQNVSEAMEPNHKYVEKGNEISNANFYQLVRSFKHEDYSSDEFRELFIEAHSNNPNISIFGATNYIDSTVLIECVTQDTLISSGGRMPTAVTNTAGLVAVFSQNIDTKSTYFNMDTSKLYPLILEFLTKYFEEKGTDCMDIVSYDYRPDLSYIAENLSLFDIFLTSFNYHLELAFLHVNTKFLHMEVKDLNSDIIPMLAQTHSISGYTLGFTSDTWTAYGARRDVLYKFNIKPEQPAYIPFTLLMNSTIIASILFWLFFIIRFITNLGLRVLKLAIKVLPNIKYEELICTSLAVTTVIVGLIVIGTYQLIGQVFNLASALLF